MALAPGTDLFVFGGCAAQFSMVGGIPWLFADPLRALGNRRFRLSHYLEEFAVAARAADADRAATTGRRRATG